MVYVYHLHMDQRRISISGQYYGSVFPKNHILDAGGNAGSEMGAGSSQESEGRTACRASAGIHSDRGVQYTCGDYKEATKGMERSYSAKASQWDNACIESFHALIKREWINRFQIMDYSHAYRIVFEYIEAFYNTVRIHSHCGYQSPAEYEKRYLDKMELKIKGMA